MPFIFISYRWTDSSDFVDRLYQNLLGDRFSQSAIFRDTTHIRGGDEINAKILTALLDCEVFLPVIGMNWLKDEKGVSRIFEPDDRVRLEIRTALSRQIRIIPVLIDGASLPKPDELPEDIRSLSDPNILYRSISDDNFSDLLTDIRRVIPFEERLRIARWDGKISYEQALGLDQLTDDDREAILEEQLKAEKSEYELQETANVTQRREIVILLARLLKQHDEIKIKVGCVYIVKDLKTVRLALKCPILIPRSSVWSLMNTNGWRKSAKSGRFIKVFREIADRTEAELMKIGEDVVAVNGYADTQITKSSIKVLSQK